VDVGLARIECEGRPVVCSRLIVLTLPTVERDEVDMGLHSLGIDAQGFLLFDDRLGDPAGLLEIRPAAKVRH